MNGKQTLSNLENRGSMRTAMNEMFDDLYNAGVPFRATVRLTSALAGTAVHIVPVADVADTEQVFVLGHLLNVNGAAAWTDSTATVVKLQDTDDAPAITFPKAILTGNALIPLGASGPTVDNVILRGIGLTAGAGLDLVADGNFAAGSDIYATVWGFIGEVSP